MTETRFRARLPSYRDNKPSEIAFQHHECGIHVNGSRYWRSRID